MVPLRGLNGARGQLLDLLREVEAGGWHGDEQALVGVLELGMERFVLFLVVDGAKKLGVELPGDGIRRLHRIGQHDDRQQHHDHSEHSEQERALCQRGELKRIRRLRRHSRRVQLPQDDVLEDVLRDHVIVVEHEAERAECGDRLGGRHLQLQQIRFRHDGGRQPAGHLLFALFFGGKRLEHVAAEERRERIGDLRGRGQVGKDGGIARVFRVDRDGRRGGILRLIKALRRRQGQHGRDQAHCEDHGDLAHDAPQDADWTQIRPDGGRLFFHCSPHS